MISTSKPQNLIKETPSRVFSFLMLISEKFISQKAPIAIVCVSLALYTTFITPYINNDIINKVKAHRTDIEVVKDSFKNDLSSIYFRQNSILNSSLKLVSDDHITPEYFDNPEVRDGIEMAKEHAYLKAEALAHSMLGDFIVSLESGLEDYVDWLYSDSNLAKMIEFDGEKYIRDTKKILNGEHEGIDLQNKSIGDDFRDEYSRRVIEPHVAEIKLQAIASATTQAYFLTLKKDLPKVQSYYDLPEGYWNDYLDIATVTIFHEGRYVEKKLSSLVNDTENTVEIATSDFYALDKKIDGLNLDLNSTIDKIATITTEIKSIDAQIDGSRSKQESIEKNLISNGLALTGLVGVGVLEGTGFLAPVAPLAPAFWPILVGAAIIVGIAIIVQAHEYSTAREKKRELEEKKEALESEAKELGEQLEALESAKQKIINESKQKLLSNLRKGMEDMNDLYLYSTEKNKEGVLSRLREKSSLSEKISSPTSNLKSSTQIIT